MGAWRRWQDQGCGALPEQRHADADPVLCRLAMLQNRRCSKVFLMGLCGLSDPAGPDRNALRRLHSGRSDQAHLRGGFCSFVKSDFFRSDHGSDDLQNRRDRRVAARCAFEPAGGDIQCFQDLVSFRQMGDPGSKVRRAAVMVSAAGAPRFPLSMAVVELLLQRPDLRLQRKLLRPNCLPWGSLVRNGTGMCILWHPQYPLRLSVWVTTLPGSFRAP